jgi:prevent-host-death family protein
VKTVNIHEAKTHLSRLIEQVAAGEEIVIARNGRPVARLVSVAGCLTARRPGQWRGRVRIGADFDSPLPAEVAAGFGLDE